MNPSIKWAAARGGGGGGPIKRGGGEAHSIWGGRRGTERSRRGPEPDSEIVPEGSLRTPLWVLVCPSWSPTGQTPGFTFSDSPAGVWTCRIDGSSASSGHRFCLSVCDDISVSGSEVTWPAAHRWTHDQWAGESSVSFHFPWSWQWIIDRWADAWAQTLINDQSRSVPINQ